MFPLIKRASFFGRLPQHDEVSHGCRVQTLNQRLIRLIGLGVYLLSSDSKLPPYRGFPLFPAIILPHPHIFPTSPVSNPSSSLRLCRVSPAEIFSNPHFRAVSIHQNLHPCKLHINQESSYERFGKGTLHSVARPRGV